MCENKYIGTQYSTSIAFPQRQGRDSLGKDHDYTNKDYAYQLPVVS